MKFDPSRRAILKGGAAAAIAFGVEALMSSPALATLRDIYKDAPLPPARKTPEAFRAWYFEREKRFQKAVSDPRVRKVLEAPIDERLNPHELDSVMQILVDKWPVAANEQARHLPEADFALTSWLEDREDAKYPSIHVVEDGGSGSGTCVELDGQEYVYTAQHVVEPSKAYITGDPRDDFALMPMSAYLAARKLERSALPPAIPLRAAPRGAAGSRVSIAARDPGDPLAFDKDKKIFIGHSLPARPAVMLWILLHAQPDLPELQEKWDEYLKAFETKDATGRDKIVQDLQHFYATMSKQFLFGDTDVLMMLPPGETRLGEDGKMPAMCTSGAGVRSGGAITGSVGDGISAYMHTTGFFRRSLCYSFAILKMNAAAATEAVRARKA